MPEVPSISVPGLGAIPIKYFSLLLLVFQNCGAVIIMKYAREANVKGPQALNTSVMIMQEVMKVVVSTLLVFREAGSLTGFKRAIEKDIFNKPTECAKLTVPSILYGLQNNLILIGIANLPAAIFHVTYQSKLLATALLSVIMLGKSLTNREWSGLGVLTLGVVFTQLKSGGSAPTGENPFLGLIATIGACLCSGFAGVYFEKLLKSSDTSVWVRNIQLGIGGFLTGCFVLVQQDYDRFANEGFFVGYNWATWSVVLVNAGGGLLIAVVIKYADNILKGFATALAIILSSILSMVLFGFLPSHEFVLGTMLVLFSVYLYTPQPPPPKPSQREVELGPTVNTTARA